MPEENRGEHEDSVGTRSLRNTLEQLDDDQSGGEMEARGGEEDETTGGDRGEVGIGGG